MNNKMAIYTYLSTIESIKQTKQRRRTELESWIWRAFCWLPDGRGSWGSGGGGEGIKKYKQVVTEQPWGSKVQYRKWGSQRTYSHDSWT